MNDKQAKQEYRCNKYSGGVYCGNAELDSIQACIDFANDGFCDYVRIIGPDGSDYRIHFKTPENS